ncbi:hypothetical protein OE903_08275 [Bacillus sp. B6(2022)]|nr:hypothetical protein [Bacillus sp. B6(2022)]
MDHMINWNYDLIKIIHEEKLKELLLDETAQKDEAENSLYMREFLFTASRKRFRQNFFT